MAQWVRIPFRDIRHAFALNWPCDRAVAQFARRAFNLLLQVVGDHADPFSSDVTNVEPAD